MTSPMQNRADQVHKAIDDELVTTKETLVFTYYWVRYEIALKRENRAINRRAKYGQRMKDMMAVFNARHEMKDL